MQIMWGLFIFELQYVISAVYGNKTDVVIDLNKCKLTHLGTEYTGKVARSETNATCQYWSRSNRKEAEELLDATFPDGSKSLAKNYCRNPNSSPDGPWCFTVLPDLIFDVCDVRLCRLTDCRISGPGMEYSGSIMKTSTGRECTKWTSSHNLKMTEKEAKFKSKFFPDDSIKEAKKKCRNPDGNPGGPWCYVETDKDDLHVKEFCDIPFCDDIDPIMYSQGDTNGRYFFFTNFTANDSLKFSIRLWNPNDWLRARVYLLLSAIDVYGDRNEIENWGSGIEIILGHSESGILISEENVLKETPHILSGAKWTNLEVSWIRTENYSLLVHVFEGKKSQPIAVTEISTKGKVLENSDFRFFSLSGSPAFWNYSSSEEECLVHTASQLNFTRFWQMRKTIMGIELEYFVRGVQGAIVMFCIAPTLQFPQIRIVIGENDKVKIVYRNNKNVRRVLKEESWPNLINLWRWEHFKVTMLDNRLQVHWIRKTGAELVIDITDSKISQMMWVSFGSKTATYWTIYCDPRGYADPPNPVPPECVSKEGDEHFNGTQSITSLGHQCTPWIYSAAIPETYQKENLFSRFGGKTISQNYCRNLNGDPKGPFCFVRDAQSQLGFTLEYCYPRLCSSGDCKLAGTANDYTGKLNYTRSRRQCKPWIEYSDNQTIHVNNFPDPSLEEASNFCRNPTKNVGGSWCFTTDPEVPKDFCYVKDCQKPLECTILISGYKPNRYYYILPRWRKYGLQFWLKTWNPDIYEGLIIKMVSADYSQNYQLAIGDENNEKLKFYYNDKLLLHKTMPHLIPSGKWGGFWLRPGNGKVELGYHGVKNSFFEWIDTEKEMSFEPMFLEFGTILGHWIGVNFDCSECLTEKTFIIGDDRLYPINLWNEKSTQSSSFILNLRGSGAALITLIRTPSTKDYLIIRINETERRITFQQDYTNNDKLILANYDMLWPLLSGEEWSKYEISFTEEELKIVKDNMEILSWKSQHLIFYWFSVSANESDVIWSANCPPEDIDWPPRDGSWGPWGPWVCSVSCGKGEGRTERSCDNPSPNVYGKECKGLKVYEGPCNDFPCGEISPDTNDVIRTRLSSNYTSVFVEKDNKVTLYCNPDTVRLVTSEVPEINLTWTHNGFPVNRFRLYLGDDFELTIMKAQEKDSGVYLCIANQDPDSVPSKIILDVVSLAVTTTKPSRHARKTKSLALTCNGVSLGYVYADLSQKWEVNGVVWKDYGVTTLQATAADKVDNITEAHAGIWTCSIIQEDFGFKWTTNWFYLEVKRAPSFWSHLMEDTATSPIFGKLPNENYAIALFSVFVIITLGAAITITVLIIKWLR